MSWSRLSWGVGRLVGDSVMGRGGGVVVVVRSAEGSVVRLVDGRMGVAEYKEHRLSMVRRTARRLGVVLASPAAAIVAM